MLFVHGRPRPHPLHEALARSVGADLLLADRVLPVTERSSRLWRYASWTANALLLPRRYDLYLAESTQVPPALARKAGLLRRDQRLAALMADQTLYFLWSHAYPRATERLLSGLLRSFDALVCMGEMQTQLASSLVAAGRTRVLGCRPCLTNPDRARLPGVRPPLDGHQLLFVGHGPEGWRARYKGIDLLLDAARVLRERGRRFELRVAGSWRDELVRRLLAERPGLRDCVSFVGEVPDPTPLLSSASLYVHLGRGDAWAVAVLEALAAGVPALTSEWTGAREAVRRVDPRLVVPLDPDAAADAICWYLDLDSSARAKLSTRSREIAAEYSERSAFERFAGALGEAMADGTPAPPVPTDRAHERR